MRGLGSAVWFVLAMCLTTLPGVAQGDVMDVPGGTEAVARLLDHVDPDLARFTESLNRALLGGITAELDWRLVRKRSVLFEYLETVAEVEAAFGTNIRLRGESDLQPTFEKLAHILGYRYTRSATGPVIEPTTDDHGEFARMTAQALSWDMYDIGTRLRDNETVVLSIVHDTVATPMPLDAWSTHTMVDVHPGNALETMAADQRMCLLAEGLRRVSSETRPYLDRDGLLARVYMHSAPAFYRYASSLTVRDGALVIPGGPSAAAAWQEMLRADPAEPHAFLRALLRPGQVHLLYLWHALSFVTDAQAAFYTQAERLELWSRTLPSLDVVITPGAARGEGPGLAVLARSLPIAADTGALDLAAGTGVWSEAMRGGIQPGKENKLARSAAKSSSRQVPDERFVARAMQRSTSVLWGRSPALSRVIHTANSFHEHPGVLSAENVLLLARATERYPMALDSLERLELRDPESVHSHLLAVAHLDQLGHGVEKFVLIANFQGGVELLVALTTGGHVPAEEIERLLLQWNEIHRTATSPYEAAPLQLAWLGTLADELPEVPEDRPGRGPAEAALLAALVPRHDPQAFTWQGLEYVGHRGRDIADRMRDHSVRQGIPPFDDLLAIRESFVALTAACEAGDVDAAATHAAAAAGQWSRLPAGDLGALPSAEYYRDWLEPVDRARGIRALAPFEQVRDPKKLSKPCAQAVVAEGFMAREIRPFLLAPVYLIGMGELDSLLFREVNLIRKHTPIRFVKSQVPGSADTPWQRTDFVPGVTAPIGSHFSGHIGGVAHALQEFHAASASDEGSGTISDTRSRGFRDSLSTPWYALEVWHARAVTALIAAGSDILNRAADGDAAARIFVLRRIPDARFERWSRNRAGELGPSDRFMIGLAAFDGDAYGSAPARILDPATTSTLAAIASERQGSFRANLDVVGSTTPAINGRRHRWVGTWTAYEAVEDERGTEPIVEREIVDLRLAVIDYLGRKGLPGNLGADLILPVLEDMPDEVDPATDRDWETVVRWISAMDDAYFEERLRQCMVDDLYRLR